MLLGGAPGGTGLQLTLAGNQGLCLPLCVMEHEHEQQHARAPERCPQQKGLCAAPPTLRLPTQHALVPAGHTISTANALRALLNTVES